MNKRQIILFVTAVVLLGIYLSRRTKGEDSIYLIPDGFRGKCIVIWDQPDGTEPEYDNGWRVYRFPKTGILLTQMGVNKGTMNFKYFLIDSLGNRTELRYLWPTDTCDFNDVVVVNHESGGIEQHFFVGTQADLDEGLLSRIGEHRVDSLLREINYRRSR
jgi:hypothetical protein